MTMQTSLEELTEKAQKQSAEAAVQVKEATGAAVNKALRVTEAAWYDTKTKASELQSACESYMEKSRARICAAGVLN
jgi:hypothetical protein